MKILKRNIMHYKKCFGDSEGGVSLNATHNASVNLISFYQIITVSEIYNCHLLCNYLPLYFFRFTFRIK